jgi:hypothetical protein
VAAETQDSDTSQPGADWGRIADGVFLVGLGIFFFVAQAKGLPDGFWLELVPFWPILLVSLGLRILFAKTRMAWAVLLGPALVLTALFWLGFGARPELPTPGEWRSLSADRPPDIDRVRVLAKLAGVRIDLEARALAPSLVARGRVASRASEPRVQVSEDDGEATLRLTGRRNGIVLIGSRREFWELAVSDRLPLTTELDGAFIHAKLDLRAGQVVYGAVNGAFNSVILHLPRASETVKIRFEGAFNTFDVSVPEGTPVSIQGPGFPLNLVDEGPAKGRLSDDQPGYHVILDGAFNSVDIREDPVDEAPLIDG